MARFVTQNIHKIKKTSTVGKNNNVIKLDVTEILKKTTMIKKWHVANYLLVPTTTTLTTLTTTLTLAAGCGGDGILCNVVY